MAAEIIVAVIKYLASSGIYQSIEEGERLFDQIQAVLFETTQKEITDERINRWLDSLRHLAYDIVDVLNTLATQATKRRSIKESGGSTNKVKITIHTIKRLSPSRWKMMNKLTEITTKLRELKKEKHAIIGLIVKDGKSNKMNRGSETSFVDSSTIVGRQRDKEALLRKLLGHEPSDQNFNIVPIVGMGGIGKTTLARFLYNDKQVQDHFDLKAWVCVSVEFDILRITKVIFQSVTRGNQEFEDLDQLQVALEKRLSDKRFLLVLDDIWIESRNDWQLLQRPLLAGAPGSKIIMTTRKSRFLCLLGYDRPHCLQILSHEDALSLFSQHALGENNFDSHPTLKPHGEAIVKKCDGLPLALIALGRLLRTKTIVVEWEDLLNSEIWNSVEQNEIIRALELSYYDLPLHLKQLFAYCSLFPKEYVFDMDELVLLWMAEGLLETSPHDSLESVGRECFQDLVSRSFFRLASEEKSLYVMHGLMNDLARFIAGDIFIRLDANMVTSETLVWYRHLSFTLPKFGVYKFPVVFQKTKILRTFLAVPAGVRESWGSFYLSNKVLVDLLPKLPLLRVLHLSDYEINEVPDSIGSLKNLQYLNLSRTNITQLPNQVGDLYNLQTILMRGCKELKTLPYSFLKLKNLRHVDINDTPLLEKTPLGIGKLRSLQTMSKVIIEGGNGFRISELKDLNGLHGRLSIKQMDKIKNANEAKMANLFDKELNELEMEWSDLLDDERNKTLEGEVLNMLKPHHEKLRKLTIVSYGGNEFPSWVGDPSFHRLEHVTIRGCKKCTSLPPLGQLSKLKELYVEGMHGVKDIGYDILGNGYNFGGVAFRSLEILSFADMQGWDTWSINSGAFPRIRELRMKHCRNLVVASLEVIPSLQVLEISGCGDGLLRSIVRAVPSVTKLKMENISGLTHLNGGVIECLGAVEDMEIRNCHELRYIWDLEVEASKILANLRTMRVENCSNLVSLGEKEDDNCGSSLTCLREMSITSCYRLERFSCPNSIVKLVMDPCRSVTSISFPTGGQELKTLSLSFCDKLSEVYLNNSFSLLESVYIDGWLNLKSFPDLSCFIHLASLSISNCKNLMSFPDDQLVNLTRLRNLTIRDCPSMSKSFPRGLWPPNLSDLHIGGLKKPSSKWGPQNFPTSLVHLRLAGGSREDVVSGGQLAHLLPSSLISLSLRGFKKLESLSNGLQHLTSLEGLSIWCCPIIRDLPETLLPQISNLWIGDCPKLKERCSRNKRGSYWPHISHIPCIYIDGELCS